MRGLFGSLLAISVASIAAIAATTALLNTPVRTVATQALPVNAPTPATPPTTAAPPAASPPAGAPAGTPDAGKPTAGDAKPDATKPADEADEDPYAGIAPEELPPDLQYSADSSVSFPTNI
jgi:hypothetical protein